jgi:hypothetical protein
MGGTINRNLFRLLDQNAMPTVLYPVINYFLSEIDVEYISNLVGHYIIGMQKEFRFESAFKKRYGNNRIITSEMDSAYKSILIWAEVVSRIRNFHPENISQDLANTERLFSSDLLHMAKNHFRMLKPTLNRIDSENILTEVSSASRNVYPNAYSNWVESSRKLFCDHQNSASTTEVFEIAIAVSQEIPELLHSQLLAFENESSMFANSNRRVVLNVFPLIWSKEAIFDSIEDADVLAIPFIIRTEWDIFSGAVVTKPIFVSSASFELPCSSNIFRLHPNTLDILNLSEVWIRNQNFDGFIILQDEEDSNHHIETFVNSIGYSFIQNVTLPDLSNIDLIYTNVVDSFVQSNLNNILIIDGLMVYNESFYNKTANLHIPILRLNDQSIIKNNHFTKRYYIDISLGLYPSVVDTTVSVCAYNTIQLLLQYSQTSMMTPLAFYTQNWTLTSGKAIVDFNNQVITPFQILCKQNNFSTSVHLVRNIKARALSNNDVCYYGHTTNLTASWSKLRIVTCIFEAIIVLVAAAAVFWLIRNLDHSKIARSGSYILVVFMIACIVGLLSEIVKITPIPTELICITSTWMFFCGLFTATVSIILICLSLLERPNKRSIMNKKAMSPSKWKLVLPINVLFAILLVKTILDSQVLTISHYNVGLYTVETYLYCSRTRFDDALLVTWRFLITTAIVLSLQVRGITNFKIEGNNFTIISVNFLVMHGVTDLLAHLNINHELFFLFKTWPLILSYSVAIISTLITTRLLLKIDDTEEIQKCRSISLESNSNSQGKESKIAVTSLSSNPWIEEIGRLKSVIAHMETNGSELKSNPVEQQNSEKVVQDHFGNKNSSPSNGNIIFDI